VVVGRQIDGLAEELGGRLEVAGRERGVALGLRRGAGWVARAGAALHSGRAA